MNPRTLVACTLLMILILANLPRRASVAPAAPKRIDANSVSNSTQHPILTQTVNDFRLTDHRGNEFSFTSFRDARLTVIAFLGTECPLAKLYGGRLEALSQDYRNRGVKFVGICSNAQDSQQDVTDFAQRHQINFPVLKDRQHQVADQLKAIRTPEVFLLDHDRRVVYWGRIDDQYAIGIKKAEPQRSDLKIAIDESLAGNTVSVPIAKSVGCHIGRIEQPVSKADLTFHEHIVPLLNKHCVHCHRKDNIAPFALLDYNEVIGWAPMIREVVVEDRMPPWFANPEHGAFKNDARLNSVEKANLLRWIDSGCPQGQQDSAARQAVLKTDSQEAKWDIPLPDEVFFISDEPHTIPAQGQVEYEYFLVDPGFQEDKFLQAVQVIPGNFGVVHHALVSLALPGAGTLGIGNCGVLINYAPGMQSTNLPKGMAIHVPAGAKFLFQMHYTPNGTKQEDRTSLGMVFADPKEVKSVVRGGVIANVRITVPANARNHREFAETKVDRDVHLLSLSPHMHLRGKAFRYEAIFPNGRIEILLDVPKYDFNWQLRYLLKQPLALPTGTRLRCTAWYDNSSSNSANPDPQVAVRWGDQTTDEMLIGFYSVVDTR